MSDDRTPRDARKVHIPAPGASAPAAAPAPAPKVGRAPAAAPAGRQAAVPLPGSGPVGSGGPGGPSGPTGPGREPRSGGGGKRRRLLPQRPKLRRVLFLTSLLMPLVLLAVVVGGWFYAKGIFDKIERVEVSDVLSHGGSGENYLIVGSDNRDPAALEAAGLNPKAFGDVGGERSDTILLLRFEGGKAKMLSIPRDLYIKIAETGQTQKINAAYGGGPRRLILTIQQSLGIPVHHYVEIDFVSFAGLVDSVGGVDIDFPTAAIDHNSGLDVKQAGVNHLDGPMALAFVRSRHYQEVQNGKEQPERNRGDLDRVLRQQQFLTAILGELGQSKNPFTLARAADSISGGIRIDDDLGLTAAMRLAWRLRGMHPESIDLHGEPARAGDQSIVKLVHPESDQAIAQFQ